MDAFDADVLIYACVRDHPLGEPVRALFRGSGPEPVGVGSVLLIPELLTKPTRGRAEQELRALELLLGRVATAVNAGADRFITNNRSDFTLDIEIDVAYPEFLG